MFIKDAKWRYKLTDVSALLPSSGCFRSQGISRAVRITSFIAFLAVNALGQSTSGRMGADWLTVSGNIASTCCRRKVTCLLRNILMVQAIHWKTLFGAVNKIKKKLEWKFLWTNLKQSDSSRLYTFVSGSDLNNFETKIKLPVTDTSKFKSNNKAK